MSIITAASTAYAGTITLETLVPSPANNVVSTTLEPGAIPPGACKPGTLRVSSAYILQFCNESGAWGFLRGVFRQDGSTVSLSDTTDIDYYFYMGPNGGTVDQGITIPKNGGIVAKGTFNSGPDLTTAGAGTRFIWYPKKAAIRAGTVTGTQWDNANVSYYSVAFGQDNQARSFNSGVLSGASNIAGQNASIFIEGLTSGAVVAGGVNNQALAGKASILGGWGNIADGGWSTIGGGVQNRASGALSFIGGGGDQTQATWNTASGTASSIVGGQNNTASGNSSSIGGGAAHTASNDYATVSGGFTNTASGISSTVSGGSTNTASAQASTVAGGNLNQANGINSSVLGGTANIAGGNNSTVLGGYNNQANGDTAIAGGANLIVSGARSVALGHPGAATTVSQNDAIVLYPQGNVGVGTTTPAYKLDVNGNGRYSGDLITTGSVGVGVAVPAQSLHISAAMKMEPMDSPPAADDGVMYYSSSGALCIFAGGMWTDLLGGKLGGVCE